VYLSSEEKILVAQTADRLIAAFSWAESTQGYDYWWKVFSNLNKLAGIDSPPSFDTNRRTPGSSPSRTEEVSNMLIESFFWSDTPQGSNYWGDVYSNLLLNVDKAGGDW
jgi:hypothetical protein